MTSHMICRSLFVQVKCTQYWPDTVGQTEHFGYITVTFVKSTSHADYCIRDFEIQTVSPYSLHAQE